LFSLITRDHDTFETLGFLFFKIIIRNIEGTSPILSPGGAISIIYPILLECIDKISMDRTNPLYPLSDREDGCCMSAMMYLCELGDNPISDGIECIEFFTEPLWPSRMIVVSLITL
jgi:hypothetical protein